MYIEDENISSAANFIRLRKECKMLADRYSQYVNTYSTPEIMILAKEYQDHISNRTLEELGRECYDNLNKIEFVKIIRERFPGISLIKAKMMADGFWLRFKS